MKRTEYAAGLAVRLVEDLHQAEASQDDAVSQLGRLAQSLTRTRREAGLSTTVGQPAFDALADALNAQIQAQRAVVALHHALAETQSRTAFRNVRLGGYPKTEDDPPRPKEGIALATA